MASRMRLSYRYYLGLHICTLDANYIQSHRSSSWVSFGLFFVLKVFQVGV